VRALTRWTRAALTTALVAAATVSIPEGLAVGAATLATGPVGRTIACSSSEASAPTLGNVKTTFVSGMSSPFGVTFSSDGKYVYADSPSSPFGTGSQLTEYAPSPSGHLVAERTGTFPNAQLLGMGRSPDGRYLAAANESGVEIFSISRMEQNGSKPSSWPVGILSSAGLGAIEVSFSPDGNYLFVTLENSREIAVFNFEKAIAQGFGPSDLVGYVPLGLSPVGMALSANGRYLFATSEESPSALANRVPGSNSLTLGAEGTLSIIDLHIAEHDPSRSVVSTLWAGCSPVRVAATRTEVYVAARGSDEIVAFSAPKLLSDPSAAQTGSIRVGESPVGLALVDHNSTVVVSDSNRFEVRGAASNLAVVTDRGGANLRLVGYVKAGDFPRDMAVSPDGRTLVVSNYASGQVEDVDLAGLLRSS
jgi:DNA-binding beta-propeller fold protein YncE